MLVSLSAVYSLLAPLYRLFLGFPLLGLASEQRAAARFVKGKRVLEVGCGTGYMLARIASIHREVTGLDLSAGMLRQARKRLRGSLYKINLIRASYYDIPFPAGYFDSVLATFTLTHAADLAPVAAELSRVLAPGGRLVIVDAGPANKSTVFSKGINRLWRFLGDHPRGEEPILSGAGLKTVYRRELSKFGTVHLLVAVKPA
ncbi:methyltransferase domain-containing protein [candidate division WOR-3 bacterium]|uniref:Methyltransferase domain-containing protein n=1 Tax=candidate division WOR-3 bacterium TaxID=2052148 RepID=A0A9D5KA85_UNCW3|nr:methyltransferase domain-containing protein [candidate division WOR-3 bacterium]MBD3364131.1 methyltransferase domain-containing protein [candidate division WOR-3 bacterium]